MSDNTTATGTPKKVYGIDLGTTYSALAVVIDGKAEIIKNNQEGSETTASAVFYDNATQYTVGEYAKSAAQQAPENLVEFVKREMGTGWKRVIHGIELTPEIVSGHILARIAEDARRSGHDVKDVVITCPAYFGEKEREATRSAGRIAGLNVIALLDEPVAAAFHYGLNKAESDGAVVVYDLGGGTFDATVIKIEKGLVAVVCTDGSRTLGGVDWDKCIQELVVEKFTKETGVSKEELFDDPDTKFLLRQKSEEAKRRLTQTDSARITITHGPHRQTVEITLAEFNEKTRRLLEKTTDLTQNMIDLAKTKGVTKINNFLLVGGSVKMRQILEMVKAKFASQVDVITEQFEVDTAVAKGAALYGLSKQLDEDLAKQRKKLEEEARASGTQLSPTEIEEEATRRVANERGLTPSQLTDMTGIKPQTVATKSYGVRIWNKTKNRYAVANLIRKQTPIPSEEGVKGEGTYGLLSATGPSGNELDLIVYENNNMADEEEMDVCVEVGRTSLKLHPNMQEGAPISVTFKLNDQGSLSMVGRDVTNGTTIDAHFTVKGGLSDEAIQEAAALTASLTKT